MRVCLITALAIAGSCLPAGAVPERFDLICHIRALTTGGGVEPIDNVSDTRMSVDLGRRLWCWHNGAACSKVLPVADSGGDVLKLGSVIGAQGDSRIEVDLSSGAFQSLVHVRVGSTPEITSRAKGRCTKAPFTPGIL